MHKHTHKHIQPQTGPITTHCAAKLNAQCNDERVDLMMMVVVVVVERRLSELVEVRINCSRTAVESQSVKRQSNNSRLEVES